MAALCFKAISLSMAIIVLVQPANSIVVNEDKVFMEKWNTLLNRVSPECKRFATGASADALGHLTFDKACSVVKSDTFKDTAFETCTQSEYDAAVALVCVRGSAGGSGNQGSTLNENKSFLKKWVALVTTFSISCRRFVVGSSTEPIGDLTTDQACKYVKTDGFKNSVLEACSQQEYGASVELVCHSHSGSTHVYLACTVMLLSLFLHLLRKV